MSKKLVKCVEDTRLIPKYIMYDKEKLYEEGL